MIEMQRVLALDVGGAHIRMAWVDAEGVMGEEVRCRVDLSRHDACADDVIQVIADMCQDYMQQHGGVDAVTLGFPGFFSGDDGVLLSSPNMPQLKDVALADGLSAMLSCPVMAQNDALCAALGEQCFGAGKGEEHLVHITLGTGVGAGLILHQQAYAGASGMAMEFGHLMVKREADARWCGCGHRGCLEAYASVTAIQAQYAEALGDDCDAAVIYQRALDGDTLAQVLFEQAGAMLGQALAEVVKLLDVHMVTVSGGLLGAWQLLYTPLLDALNAGVMAPQRGKIQVVPSTLGDAAGILGAAALAWQA